MNIPTAQQALVFWLHASGMTYKMIAEELDCTPESARSVLVNAQRNAKKIGLTYNILLKKPKPMPNESGMSIALRLAREANLIQ